MGKRIYQDDYPIVINSYEIYPNGFVNNYLIKHKGEIVEAGLTLEGAKAWIASQPKEKEVTK